METHVLRLQGTDPRLYQLVAPLVMNPAVIKQNLGFPFRTAENFVWYVLTGEEDHVLGFLPVEHRPMGLVVNNYYIDKEAGPDALRSLLTAFLDNPYTRPPLYVLSLNNDVDVYAEFGFTTYKEWKRYVKMVRL